MSSEHDTIPFHMPRSAAKKMLQALELALYAKQRPYAQTIIQKAAELDGPALQRIISEIKANL